MNADMLPADQLQTFLTCLSNPFPSDGSIYREDDESLSFLPLSSPGFDHESDSSSVHSPNSHTYDDGPMKLNLPPFPMDSPDVVTDGPKMSQSGRGLIRKQLASSAESTKGVLLPPESIEELLEEADLKRKRLARKAELARVSRKRKKMRIEELEGEVAELKRELERERKRSRQIREQKVEREVAQPNKIKSVPSANSSQEAEKRMTEAVSAMVKGPTGTSNEAQLVRGFYEAFKHKVEVNTTHLDLLGKGARPCMPLRFVQWLMAQGDKFYKDPNGLWNSLLAQEVGASPEQLSKLQNLRKELVASEGATSAPAWAEIEQAAARFDQLLRSHMACSSQSLERFMDILTPEQLVAFFKWVDRFGGVCIKINL